MKRSTRAAITGALLLLIYSVITPFSSHAQTKRFTPGERYYHPTGLFSVVIPEGWPVSTVTETTPTDKDNPFAIVTHYLEPKGAWEVVVDQKVSLLGPEFMSEYANTGYYDYLWINYASWKEIGRYTDGERFVADFDLVGDDKPLVGRETIATVDGHTVYVRAIVPGTEHARVAEIENILLSSLVIYDEAYELPLSWNAAVHAELGFIVRYPSTVDAAHVFGKKKTFEVTKPRRGRNYEMLTSVEDNYDLGDDRKKDTAARQWVGNNYPGAKILRTRHLNRVIGDGWAVSFTLRFSNDGQRASGLAVLLNDDKKRLYALQTIVPLEDRDMLNSFSLSPLSIDTADLRKMLILLPPDKEITPLPDLNPIEFLEFNFDNGTFTTQNSLLYTSPDGIISTMLPPKWKSIRESGEYIFAGYNEEEQVGIMRIEIGEPGALYKKYLSLDDAENLDPKAALEQYYTNTINAQPRTVWMIPPVSSAKIGTLDGYRLYMVDSSPKDATKATVEYRIAQLTKDRIIIVEQSASESWWVYVNYPFKFILENLKVNLKDK